MNFNICSKSSLRIGEITLKRSSKCYKTPLLLHLFPNFSKEVFEIAGMNLEDLAILVPVDQVYKLENAVKASGMKLSKIIGFDGEFNYVYSRINHQFKHNSRLFNIHDTQKSIEILSITIET